MKIKVTALCQEKAITREQNTVKGRNISLKWQRKLLPLKNQHLLFHPEYVLLGKAVYHWALVSPHILVECDRLQSLYIFCY